MKGQTWSCLCAYECVEADADEPSVVASVLVVFDGVAAVSAGDEVGSWSDAALEGE